MSTASINLAFDDFARALRGASAHLDTGACRDAVVARGSDEACEPLAALRVALLYGEQLRLPDSSRELQVLSGRAWVSQDGEDYILGSGESLAVAPRKGGAIISALGGEALFFEIH
jgi:hypothetical protein